MTGINSSTFKSQCFQYKIRLFRINDTFKMTVNLSFPIFLLCFQFDLCCSLVRAVKSVCLILTPAKYIHGHIIIQTQEENLRSNVLFFLYINVCTHSAKSIFLNVKIIWIYIFLCSEKWTSEL